MAATLTISISPEIPRTLGSSQSVASVAGPPGAVDSKPAAVGAWKCAAGAEVEWDIFHPGSLPALLVEWAGDRDQPFGVAEVMRALRVGRGRASKLLTRVMGTGLIRRVGRGTYARAGVAEAAPPRRYPLRAGSLAAKLVAWAAGCPRPFGVPDVMKALRIDRRRATGVLVQAGKVGRLRRIRHGTYAGAGAADADRLPGVSFRLGSLPARLVAWAGRRKKPFVSADVVKVLKVTPAHASMVLTQVTTSGDVKRIRPGVYVAS